MLVRLFKSMAQGITNSLKPYGAEFRLDRIVRKPEENKIEFVFTMSFNDKEKYDIIAQAIEMELKGTISIPEHIRKQLEDVERMMGI